MYKDLVDKLVKEKVLKTKIIVNAFYKIDRNNFVGAEFKGKAGIDIPLPIKYSQTISQPFTVAFMLELLKPEKGDKILDVGTGSGWTAALLAGIVGPSGKVYGIERIRELKEFGQRNVSKYGFISEGRVKMFLGDGTKGLLKYAPFDKILVSAATKEIPEALINQLKIKGRMVIPIGPLGGQEIELIKKIKGGKIQKEKYPGFTFVPLISGE